MVEKEYPPFYKIITDEKKNYWGVIQIFHVLRFKGTVQISWGIIARAITKVMDSILNLINQAGSFQCLKMVRNFLD